MYFRLIAITDRKFVKGSFINRLKALSVNGVKAIQIREKDLEAAEIVKIASSLQKTANKGLMIIINDRADIALASGACGIHSTVNGLSAEQINKISCSLLKGKSVHSIKEAINAEKEGFDYILFGPVFRTPAKVKYGPPQGIKKLSKLCSAVNLPVYAVGGINPERAKKCISAGAAGVAVIRELMNTDNIKGKVNEFRESIGIL